MAQSITEKTGITEIQVTCMQSFTFFVIFDFPAWQLLLVHKMT